MTFFSSVSDPRHSNLSVLHARFPHVSTSEAKRSGRFVVSTSERGVPTLRFIQKDGRSLWIHSRFDPISEADRLAAQWADGAKLYLMLGFGLGYHVEALLRRVPEGSKVLVAEPIGELFDLALESVPLSKILEVPNFHLAVGDELSLVDELRKLDLLTCSLKPHICIHPALVRVAPDEYRRWLDVLRGEVNRIVSDAATIVRWDLTWGRNTMENLPRAVQASPIRRLFDSFQGTPAIVVSAGPSLDLNVTDLRKAHGKALILSVDTALKVLVANGIRPHAVTAYDGGEANVRHFDGINYDEFPLIYDPMVHPAIPARHQGAQWVMTTTSNPFMAWLERAFGPVGHVLSGGSISTVTLDLAVKLGCNPIILVGQDLAYRNGRTHARGTAHGHVRVDGVQVRESRGYLQVPGVTGEPVWTSRSLYSFLTWFERYIAAAPRHLRFIDATEGGALVRGTELMTLQEAIEEHCRETVVNGDAFQNSLFPGWSPGTDRLVSFFQYTLESLDSIRATAREALRTVDQAQQLVMLGRTHRGRFQRLMNQLDKADQALLGSDPTVRALLDLASYRTHLNVLRSPAEHVEGSEGHLHVLSRSHKLYEGIEDAVARTSEVIRIGLDSLNGAPERNHDHTQEVTNRPIVHYGWHWSWGNAGDTVLFQEVRDLFDAVLGHQRWSLRNLNEPVTGELIHRLNAETRAVVIGGGGLLLRDTNPNSNSGWQWNCPPELVKRIRVPLLVFAIGYNRFPSQEEFDPIFMEHLAVTVEKSAFFGLRNLGSVRAVREYVGEGLAHKIRLQPCPTTLINRIHGKYARRHPDSEQRRLVVNIAMDRPELRFAGRRDQILTDIASALKTLAERGVQIQVAIHVMSDDMFVPYLRDAGVPYELVNLVTESPSTIREFYWKAPLSLGMRGHSQLVPFGLGNPILSLISHDKLRWFLEDIGHPEWGIDVCHDNLPEVIVETVEDAMEHLDDRRRECALAQDVLWKYSLENLGVIQEVLAADGIHSQ